MIPYIDLQITRYVLLNDIAALDNLYRCVPARFHLAHFSEQKKLFIPFLSKVLAENLKLEDQGKAQTLFKNNTFKNLTLLKIIAEIIPKLDEINANPIIISNFSNYLIGFCDFGNRAFEEIAINLDATKLDDTILILEKLGWRFSAGSPTPSKRFENKVCMEFYEHPKIELYTNKVDPNDIIESQVAGIKVKAANHNLIFFLSCLKALEREDSSWIYDSVDITKKLTLNWQKIIKLAEEYKCSFTFATILKFLKANYLLEIPSEIILNLEQKPISLAQKLEKRSFSSNKYGAKQQLELIIASFFRKKNLWLLELPAYINYKAR